MIATDSSGRQRSFQVSRKVPVPRTRSSATSPQPMPSTPSRCRNTERPPVGLLAQVERRAFALSGSIFSLSARARARRSASSGTGGAPSGTRAELLADHQVPGDERGREIVAVAHAPTGSPRLTSASPASGRPRSTARVSASRTASITCADETGRSWLAQHPGHPGQPAGDGLVGHGEQVVVPARATSSRRRSRRRTPAGSASTAPRRALPCAWACPRSSAASLAAGGSGPASAGACQAPQTTATVPLVSLSAARSTCRMCASRRCSTTRPAPASPPAARPWPRPMRGEHGAFRIGRFRSGRRLDHVVPPALGVVVAGRRGELPDRVRLCSRGGPSAVGAWRPPARALDRGPSARALGPSARRSVLVVVLAGQHHPGGQVAEPRRAPRGGRPQRAPATRARRPRTARTPTPAARPARSRAAPPAAPCPGRRPGRAAGRRRPAPRSARPSGLSWSSSAATDRADPGPWCRMPSTATRSPSGTRHPATSRQAR